MSAWTVYPDFLKTGFHVFRYLNSSYWHAVGPNFKNDFSIQAIGETPTLAARTLLKQNEIRRSSKRVTPKDFTLHSDPVVCETIDMPIEEILRQPGAPIPRRTRITVDKNPNRDREIYDMSVAGATQGTIGEKYGITQARVGVIIKEQAKLAQAETAQDAS